MYVHYYTFGKRLYKLRRQIGCANIYHLLKLVYYLLIFLYVSLEHKTSLKSLGYICSNRQKYIVWVKIIDFSFMPKIIRILRSCSMKIFCKFPTVNISKLNF